jgi:hypothetical protein
MKPGPGEQLDAAIVDPRGHAKAVKLDLMHPLRSRGRPFDGLGKLRGHELRKRRVGAAASRRTGFDGLRGRTLDDTRHDATELLALNVIMP